MKFDIFERMSVPLYEKMRPKLLSEIAGQDHLVGESGFLTRICRTQKPISLLLFGPPGCGKTTIAKYYASAFQIPFLSMTGVLQTTADLKKILKEGESMPLFRRQVILFFDEIHRLNRAQQDLFLPFLEDGSLILVGATTENPSFALNNALLSRLRVLSLNPLSNEALEGILQRYEKNGAPLPITKTAREFLFSLSQGDGRHLLNLIETIEQLPKEVVYDVADLAVHLQRRPALYDRDREGHYNLISALHKSVRGSDPDAALYWLARMLDGGEQPLFIARRMIRMATEDIGLADPQALQLALAAYQTYEMLGSPEGELALAQTVIYLALSPKSNSAYTAYQKCRQTASETGHLDPPKIILNAPTDLMKEMGYGNGYIYDHDTPNGFSGQNYFPEDLPRKCFYSPVERGFEREMKKRLDYFARLRGCLQSDR
ncbi:MAG TPA: replication-associated recombination protein A [Chlamydiales bacterium]|nr:replication-associated recombination protein A [Chlamydiales bacterium]